MWKNGCLDLYCEGWVHIFTFNEVFDKWEKKQHGNALKTYLPFLIDYCPEGWKSLTLPTAAAVARIKVPFIHLVSLRTTFALGSKLDHCQGQNCHTHMPEIHLVNFLRSIHVYLFPIDLWAEPLHPVGFSFSGPIQCQNYFRNRWWTTVSHRIATKVYGSIESLWWS